jgi:hypothetical protein
MIHINYFGPARGAFRLSKVLEDEKFKVSYDPPMEFRGVGGEPAVHVAIFVAESVAGGGLSAVGAMAVKKVVESFKKKHPGVNADVVEDGRSTRQE